MWKVRSVQSKISRLHVVRNLLVLRSPDEVLRETDMQNLTVVSPPPLDSLGSVKRFVYAALLLCTSDNYRHQLRQRLATSSQKKATKSWPLRLFLEFQIVSSSTASRFGPGRRQRLRIFLDLFSSGWLCCAFLSLSPVRGRHLEF